MGRLLQENLTCPRTLASDVSMKRKGKVNAYGNYAFLFLISLSNITRESDFPLTGDLTEHKEILCPLVMEQWLQPHFCPLEATGRFKKNSNARVSPPRDSDFTCLGCHLGINIFKFPQIVLMCSRS